MSIKHMINNKNVCECWFEVCSEDGTRNIIEKCQLWSEISSIAANRILVVESVFPHVCVRILHNWYDNFYSTRYRKSTKERHCNLPGKGWW